MKDTNGAGAGPSSYYDRQMIAEGVAHGKHRSMVGGLWDELGALQFDFLKAHGLKPEHGLLDVGCGCLRGGVHFAAYLNPGNYCGIDLNQSLLDAGRAELEALGLSDRVPPENLRQGADFDLAAFGRTFDAALAVSLFTHLPAPYLRICLERLAPILKPGGTFYASFFLLPGGRTFAEPCVQTPGITSHPERDPYHYRQEDIRSACLGLPWTARFIGEWGHPRNQLLVAFERAPEGLAPGDGNYRAFVGPPDRYDFMGASQFALLFHLGLREGHRVLDFGCGSLRLGRLLIPWLQPGRYFGIDPNRWLIDEGFAHELGQDARELKQPNFAHNADFDCTIFGQSFDFVMAQSILTHCGPDLCRRFLEQIAAVLEPDGIAVFSYVKASSPAATPKNGWHYPQCVQYTEADILDMARDAGLEGAGLAWYHPGAVWFAVARRVEYLPSSRGGIFSANFSKQNPQLKLRGESAGNVSKPLELLTRLHSFDEWRAYCAANPFLNEKRYVDILIDLIATNGFFCPYYLRSIAAKEIVMGAPNYREGLSFGGLNSRLRAVWSELSRFVKDVPPEEVRIYAPEALTTFAKLLKKCFPRFIGSEYLPNGQKSARVNNVRHEDLMALSFSDGMFDIVVVNDIFEHVPDIDKCLAEIARVVRPGGRLISTFPFNIGSHSSVVKARLAKDRIEYLTEPEFHGNPVDPQGSLVFEIPGWNILERAKAQGWVRSEIVYETSVRHGIVGSGFSGIFTLVAVR